MIVRLLILGSYGSCDEASEHDITRLVESVWGVWWLSRVVEDLKEQHTYVQGKVYDVEGSKIWLHKNWEDIQGYGLHGCSQHYVRDLYTVTRDWVMEG